jgi:hypothetical protein
LKTKNSPVADDTTSFSRTSIHPHNAHHVSSPLA